MVVNYRVSLLQVGLLKLRLHSTTWIPLYPQRPHDFSFIPNFWYHNKVNRSWKTGILFPQTHLSPPFTDRLLRNCCRLGCTRPN